MIENDRNNIIVSLPLPEAISEILQFRRVNVIGSSWNTFTIVSVSMCLMVIMRSFSESLRSDL